MKFFKKFLLEFSLILLVITSLSSCNFIKNSLNQKNVKDLLYAENGKGNKYLYIIRLV